MTASRPNSPPVWFQRAVADGIGALLVLELPARPYSDEDVRRAREVWCQALWRRSVSWDEAADAWRIQDAFLRLAGEVRRWPAPAQLLDHLPARRRPRALPAPKLSAEQRRRNSERLRAALKEAMHG